MPKIHYFCKKVENIAEQLGLRYLAFAAGNATPRIQWILSSALRVGDATAFPCKNVLGKTD